MDERFRRRVIGFSVLDRTIFLRERFTYSTPTPAYVPAIYPQIQLITFYTNANIVLAVNRPVEPRSTREIPIGLRRVVSSVRDSIYAISRRIVKFPHNASRSFNFQKLSARLERYACRVPSRRAIRHPSATPASSQHAVKLSIPVPPVSPAASGICFPFERHSLHPAH